MEKSLYFFVCNKETASDINVDNGVAFSLIGWILYLSISSYYYVFLNNGITAIIVNTLFVHRERRERERERVKVRYTF
jgi:hypothetical protein